MMSRFFVVLFHTFINATRFTIFAVSFIFLLSACSSGSNSSGGNTPPPADQTVELTEAFIHSNLTHTARPHLFYPTSRQTQDRVIGKAVFDGSGHSTHFEYQVATGSLNQIFPDLTQDRTRFEYLPESEQAVYAKDGALWLKRKTEAARKISGPEQATNRFWISEDESKLIYIANYFLIDEEYQNELFIVDLNTEEGTQLSLENVTGEVLSPNSGSDYEYTNRPIFSPNQQRVVYVFRNLETGLNELRSVKVDGTENVLLYENLFPDDDIYGYSTNFVFDITADSEYVVHIADISGELRLFSAKLDGSESHPLSNQLNADDQIYIHSGSIRNRIDFNNTHFFYTALSENPGHGQLYKASLSGEPPEVISGNLSVDSADIVVSHSLVYFQSEGGIYSMSTTGENPVLLNADIKDTIAFYEKAQLMPDGETLIYLAVPTESRNEQLYISHYQRGTTNLSGDLGEHGRVYSGSVSTRHFWFYPDGEHILFRANAEDRSDYALYLVELDGSNRQRITPDRIQDNSTKSSFFNVINNKIYFSYDQKIRHNTLLFEYDVATRQTREISATLSPFIDEDIAENSFRQDISGNVSAVVSELPSYREKAVHIYRKDTKSQCSITFPEDNTSFLMLSANYFLSPSGNHLYYTNQGDLFRASTQDCSTVNISTKIRSVDSSFGLGRMKLSPISEDILAVSGSRQLFVISNNLQTIKRVSAEATLEQGLDYVNDGAFNFLPSGDKLIYHSDIAVEDQMVLYVVDINGENRRQLSEPNLEIFRNSLGFTPKITADSQHVIYRTLNNNNGWDLMATHIASGSHTKLAEAVSTDTFSFNRDHTKVLFERNTSSVYTNLYSVNLDGSNEQQVTGLIEGDDGIVQNRSTGVFISLSPVSYQISSDNQWVYYRAINAETREKNVFRSNIDGSASSKINLTMGENSYLDGFLISKDGKQLIYKAGYEFGQSLHVLPLNQEQAATKLLDLTQGIIALYPNKNNEVVYSHQKENKWQISSVSLNTGESKLLKSLPENLSTALPLFANDQQDIFVFGDFRSKGAQEAKRFFLSE